MNKTILPIAFGILLLLTIVHAETVGIITETNETTTYTYATPPQISVFSWDFIFGIILILIGLGGMYIFAMGE